MNNSNCVSTGNYGKTAEVVVKSSKSGSQENLAEDRQPLLESDDELERDEVVNPRDQSITAPRRPQPTEYDRSHNNLKLDC